MCFISSYFQAKKSDFNFYYLLNFQVTAKSKLSERSKSGEIHRKGGKSSQDHATSKLALLF